MDAIDETYNGEGSQPFLIEAIEQLTNAKNLVCNDTSLENGKADFRESILINLAIAHANHARCLTRPIKYNVLTWTADQLQPIVEHFQIAFDLGNESIKRDIKRDLDTARNSLSYLNNPQDFDGRPSIFIYENNSNEREKAIKTIVEDQNNKSKQPK